jgi:hypothetical protein
MRVSVSIFVRPSRSTIRLFAIAALAVIMLFAPTVPSARCAEEVATVERKFDELVYKDGDRVHGKLVERDETTIVFNSDRFGELRVLAADAVVILADHAPETTKAPVVATPAKPQAVAEERADSERVSVWERFSPSVLTAKVRDYFGPWHGRLAISTEVVAEAADHNSLAGEAHLTRKWESDEVELSGRYDYSETNQVPATDLVKASALWRHDFRNTRFTQYRPTFEWNRASQRDGVPNDYVLLQQELGVGFTVVDRPSRQVRLGVSENLFDVWNSAPTADHTSRSVISLFDETEFKLPWRMTLSQRGVWYPESGAQGWENRFELNKKLTETLSASIRHEIRRNNPDGSAQDYTRLKLLLGLDF